MKHWPLVKLVMDEAHTFLFESKSKGKAFQARNDQVREMVEMLDDLVRMGRTVGIQCFLLTQKADRRGDPHHNPRQLPDRALLRPTLHRSRESRAR